MTPQRITPCLWFDRQAEEAANFYTGIFKNSKITQISRYGEAGQEVHGQKPGSVMVVAFKLDGHSFTALNGGPVFKFDEAVSFVVSTEDQDETDRYWNAIVDNNGSASECGWCKDKFGLSWQITPRRLTELFNEGGTRGKRAFEAMMTMQKIDIAALDRAVAGLDADA